MAIQIFSLDVLPAAQLEKGYEVVNLGKVVAVQKSGSNMIIYLTENVSNITKVVEIPITTNVLLKNTTL